MDQHSKPGLTAPCFQSFCFPVAVSYYICLTGIKQPIALKSSLLLSDTRNILSMLQPPPPKFHVKKFFWVRLQDVQISLLLNISLCVADLIVLAGWDMIQSIISLQFTPLTSPFRQFVGKRERGGQPRESKRQKAALLYLLLQLYCMLPYMYYIQQGGCIIH